jgi:hypothetical protein
MNIEETSSIRSRLAALLDHANDFRLLLLGEFWTPPSDAPFLACGIQDAVYQARAVSAMTSSIVVGNNISTVGTLLRTCAIIPQA